MNNKEKSNNLFILYIHHLSFLFEGQSTQEVIQMTRFLNFIIFKSLENNVSRLHLTTNLDKDLYVTFFIEKNFIYQTSKMLSENDTLLEDFTPVLKVFI